MAKRKTTEPSDSGASRRIPALPGAAVPAGRPSALIDTRVVYRGDCLDQLRKLPNACVERVYLWHRLPAGEPDGNRNYEVFWGGTKEKRAFEDRHASTAAYIECMRAPLITIGHRDVSRLTRYNPTVPSEAQQ